jgi:hypothetical protein
MRYVDQSNAITDADRLTPIPRNPALNRKACHHRDQIAMSPERLAMPPIGILACPEP